MNTLLLTGTIAPSKEIITQGYKSTSIEVEQRLSSYIKSILYYITQTQFDTIIFCENSNYKIEKTILDLINENAKKHNKVFELLQFKGDFKEIKKRGYNYGEGECIDYAIDNSLYIKKSENWFKITGRYIYYNIDYIIENWKNLDYGFYRFGILFPFGIVTAIFKCNNKMYKNLLYNLKQHTSYKENKNLEQLFYHKLRSVLIMHNYRLYNNIMPLYNLQHEGTPLNRNVFFDTFQHLFFYNNFFLNFGGLGDRLIHHTLYKLLRAKKYKDI